MKQKILLGLLLVGALVLMAGCTAGHNPSVDTANGVGHIAGFWSGIWHGMICPITFIISLFSDNVHMYEVHNNGGWYNFGFLVGASSALGKSSATVSSSLK